MTDWVDIANSAVAPKAPVTSELMNALRDNTITTMWEDVSVIYDFAVDGAVNSIQTPLFEDGWDYGLVFDVLKASGSPVSAILTASDSGGNTLNFYLYRLDGTTTSQPFVLSAIQNYFIHGDLYIPETRLDRAATGAGATSRPALAKSLSGIKGLSNSSSFNTADMGGNTSSTRALFLGGVGGKIDKLTLKLVVPTETFTSGKVTLRRIRNQAYA